MAVDMFLKIDGIEGESTDEKHKGWIEVLSFSWGIDNPIQQGSGGTGGGGRPMIQDMSITKLVDKSTPYLMKRCVDPGNGIKEATLELCESGGGKHKYEAIVMETVFITGISTGGSGGGDKPTENVQFNFAKVKWEYTPLTDGKAGSKVGPMGWNLQENKAI